MWDDILIDEIDQRLIYEELNHQISTLNYNEQEVLYFRFWENLKFKAIGEIINKTETTAHRRCRMALRKLHHPKRIEKLKMMVNHQQLHRECTV